MANVYHIESIRPNRNTIEVKVWDDDSYIGMVTIDLKSEIRVMRFLDEFGIEVANSPSPKKLTDKFLTGTLPIWLIESKNQLQLFD